MKNKIVKLPIFLGIIVAICGTLLAAIFAVTNPIIQKNEHEKAMKAYTDMYAAYNVTGDGVTEEEVDNITSCEKRAIIKDGDGKVVGVAYTCSASGFGGAVKFIVAFADGKYLSYSDISNSETAGYGKDLIAVIPEKINGITADTKLVDAPAYASAMSGKSVTGKAVAAAIENCRADYVTNYMGK